MSAGEHPRTGLRVAEQHASWREVYLAMAVETEQHEMGGER